MIAVHQHCPILAPCIFNEAHHCVNYILISYVLCGLLIPVKCEERHAFYDCVILTVPPCAINNMGHLVQREPIDVLYGL